jgi:hypothetical protein
MVLCRRRKWLTDIGDSRRDSDFNAGVALLSQFALEELVQFSIEDTVCESR